MRNRARLLAALALMLLCCTAALAGETGKAQDKGFFIKDGDFTLETEFVLHFRADYLEDQFDFNGSAFDGSSNTTIDPKLDFRTRHARANFGGQAFFPWLTWKIQTEFGGGQARIRDAWIQTKSSDHNVWKFGQFKSPFDIFKLAGDEVQNLAERPDGTNFLWPRNRDIGVMYSGRTEDKRVSWAIAFQNGNGDNQPENDNDQFMTTVRLELQNEGGFVYKLSAIDHPESVQWVAGIAFMQNPQGGLTGDDGSDDCILGADKVCKFTTVDRDAWELFGAVRGGRWQGTGTYQKWNLQDARLDENGDLDDEQFEFWDVDFGYFVSEKDEIVGRYGQWEFKKVAFDELGDASRDSADEWRLGYTHYWNGNNLKFTVDYGQSVATSDVKILGASGTEKLTTKGLRFLLGFVL